MKKKISLIYFATTFMFTVTFAQTSEITWQPFPLEIDGNPNDWTTRLRFYDADSKIKYEFRNDANYLYFVFKSDEKALQYQLHQAEMKIKITVKSKPKTYASITFSKKANGGERPPMGEIQGAFPFQTDELKLNQLALRSESIPSDTAFIKGFVFAKKFIIGSTVENNSINFAISRGNSEETAFELAIPLRELFGDGYHLNEIKSIPIQFQLNIGAPSQTNNNGHMGRSRGGMGGPGGGMGGPEGGMGQMGGPGGSPGGDMGGGEMGERPQLPQGNAAMTTSMTAKNIKFEFKLTAEQ